MHVARWLLSVISAMGLPLGFLVGAGGAPMMIGYLTHSYYLGTEIQLVDSAWRSGSCSFFCCGWLILRVSLGAERFANNKTD